MLSVECSSTFNIRHSIFNFQRPSDTLDAQRPMPNAQCPMPSKVRIDDSGLVVLHCRSSLCRGAGVRARETTKDRDEGRRQRGFSLSSPIVDLPFVAVLACAPGEATKDHD